MAEKKVKSAAKPARTKTASKKPTSTTKQPTTKKNIAAKVVKPAAAPQSKNLGMGPVEELEHFMEQAFRRPFFLPSLVSRLRFPEILGEMSPLVDIFEDGGNVVVKAEVPGMKKEDIEVMLTNDTITISGHKKVEEKVEKKDYYRVERSFGNFTRRLRLPAEVHSDKARATFKEGVLEIVVPKVKSILDRTKRIKVG
jgi:HSP20 family protein